MSNLKEYKLVKEALLKQKKQGKKLDKKLFEKYKELKNNLLIERIEKISGKKVVLKEANSFDKNTQKILDSYFQALTEASAAIFRMQFDKDIKDLKSQKLLYNVIMKGIDELKEKSSDIFVKLYGEYKAEKEKA